MMLLRSNTTTRLHQSMCNLPQAEGLHVRTQHKGKCEDVSKSQHAKSVSTLQPGTLLPELCTFDADSETHSAQSPQDAEQADSHNYTCNRVACPA